MICRKSADKDERAMTSQKHTKAPLLLSSIRSLIRVPLVAQAADYTCGVAATLSVLFYWDRQEDYYESTLAKHLRANRKDGVLSERIKHFAESHHFKVIHRQNMDLSELKGFIRDGKPVIVLLQAWANSVKIPWKDKWGDGHFAVAVGFDAERIYFMDPSTIDNYTYIPNEEFLDRWHDVDGDKRVRHLGLVIWKKKPSYDHRAILRMK
jgi:predicted double-glycine peptidase